MHERSRRNPTIPTSSASSTWPSRSRTRRRRSRPMRGSSACPPTRRSSTTQNPAIASRSSTSAASSTSSASRWMPTGASPAGSRSGAARDCTTSATRSTPSTRPSRTPKKNGAQLRVCKPCDVYGSHPHPEGYRRLPRQRCGRHRDRVHAGLHAGRAREVQRREGDLTMADENARTIEVGTAKAAPGMVARGAIPVTTLAGGSRSKSRSSSSTARSPARCSGSTARSTATSRRGRCAARSSPGGEAAGAVRHARPGAGDQRPGLRGGKPRQPARHVQPRHEPHLPGPRERLSLGAHRLRAFLSGCARSPTWRSRSIPAARTPSSPRPCSSTSARNRSSSAPRWAPAGAA